MISCTTGGYQAMSQAFHAMVRDHLIRSLWNRRTRPVLINNWKATYFDFNKDRLVSIA